MEFIKYIIETKLVNWAIMLPLNKIISSVSESCCKARNTHTLSAYIAAYPTLYSLSEPFNYLTTAATLVCTYIHIR